MFTVRRINRPAIVSALACTALVSAMGSTASARPTDDARPPAGLTTAAQQQDLRSPDARDATGAAAQQQGLTSTDVQAAGRAALAQERYYSSHGNPDAGAALAQERYYSSHGNPAPLNVPQSPAPSDGTAWLSIVLGAAGSLAIVAASADQLRRLRIRRRRAARVAI